MHWLCMEVIVECNKCNAHTLFFSLFFALSGSGRCGYRRVMQWNLDVRLDTSKRKGKIMYSARALI